ncbi:unnamed protein product [Eruca vesicaria subsp. sativa]|uniref:CUE domain-containing protein n=1 Tax=Eruca vesicaria subsp. sativa TaxID=29727 RepID=A0ABC8LX63_ERUVS|nr:unnamed protein product [Eruca vesicaria subsp. sativa]
MGFTSVYRSLTEIFPQIDARMLRAVAIEHPKDADEAASVVLSHILPSLPSQYHSTPSPSVSQREVERDLEDVVSSRHGLLVASASKSSTSSSSSSETIPLVTSYSSTKTVSNGNELTNVGPGVCPKDVESEQVQSLGKAPGKEYGDYDFFGKCFDVPSLPPKIDLFHVPEDDLVSVVPSVPQENLKSTRDFWQELMTWNQEGSIKSVGSLNAEHKPVNITPVENMTDIQQVSCFEVATGSTNDQPLKGLLASENSDSESNGSLASVNGDNESKGSLASVNGDNESKGSLASVNGDTEVDSAFSSPTHGCCVDHLEEIIEDAKTNKKTFLAVMDSVTNLMKEVELEEKEAEKSESEAARGGLDTLEKVEEFKKILRHAKEANDMHAGEVYGEKSILATEAKELENRLLNLSEERNKSLHVLDEMRETLEIRLAAALEMKKAAEQEKKEKEVSALKALAEQEAIMEKVAQESKLLQQEAEQNSKLREFLMDRGQVVDSLQGEISIICQDVKLLKEKFDNRVSITKSATSSLTISCGSSMRSLVLETPTEPLNGMLETSSNNKCLKEEEASSSMNKEKNDLRELLEDGWDIFDEEIEL